MRENDRQEEYRGNEKTCRIMAAQSKTEWDRENWSTMADNWSRKAALGSERTDR